MPTVRAGELNIHYKLSGPVNGEPIIFISGLGADWTNWQLQLAEFEQHYLCLAFDNRDSGLSDNSPDREYSIQDMARDTVELSYALGLDYAHIVGHSMGGAIAQEIAINFPERVASLTLVATFSRIEALGLQILRDVGPLNTLAQNGFISDLIAPFAVNFKYLNDQLFVRLLQEQGKRGPFNTPTEGYKRQLRAIINHDTTAARLGYISAPTMAIAGEKDLVTPNSGMLKIAQAIPGSQLYTFPNTGHAPHVEHVAEFNQLLRAHLTAHATTQYSS